MIDGLVSVIMPSWNTEQYIAESIESVLKQTYKKLELIIVDDGSTDKSEDVILKYNDPRIRYIRNKENSGAAKSRNIALKHAKGEWIAFLDSDDLWNESKLEKQLSFMKKKKCFLSYHNYEKIDENGNKLNILVTGPKTINKRKIYRYDYIGQLTMIYSAKKFGLIQIKNIKKNNDYAIRLKLFNKFDNVICFLLNENLAQYRVRTKSISHDKIMKKIRSHYDLFHWCDNNNTLLALFYTFRNMAYGVFKKIKYEKKV